MKDEHKTKQQLIDELSGLREQIDSLKTSEAQFMRAEEEMRKSYDTQRALNFLLSLSLEGTSLEEFLKRALRLILSIPWLAFESRGCIFLVEDEPGFLVMKAQSGLNESLTETCSRLPIGRCLCGRAALTQQIQFADHLDDRHEVRYEGIVNHGHYSVPILFSNKLLGVINIYVKEGHPRNQREEAFLTSVANALAEAIKRRQAEERLHSSEKKLREITSALGEGVYVVNEHGRIIFMNPEAERLLGWKETELLDKNIHEMIHYCKSNGTPLSAEDCPVLKVIRTGKKYITEDDMFIRKDGTVLPVAYISTPMIEDGRVVGSITAFRDITLRKKMEDELINVKKLESIAFLADGIAHDFNNLLTAILGNVSLVKMSISPDDKNFELLSRAEKASFRAKDLTYQLLTFAKGGEPVRKVVYIKGLIEDTVSFSLSGSNVKYDFSIQENLWPVEVDEVQLRQVIYHLSINAQEAMPKGGNVEIRAENVTVGSEDGLPVKEGRYVKISVKDHGISIPKEHLKKIFDPYFTTKQMDSQKGKGLGLAVCYSIIKKHGGYIDVESEIGKGSTFHIYIPAADKER